MRNILSFHKKQGWKPSGAIAYFPFETDMVDALGNKTITVTATGVSIATTGGVPALYNNGSGAAKINVGFTKSDITSLLMWVKTSNITQDNYILGLRNNTTDRGILVYNSLFNAVRWQNSGYTITSSANTDWCCIGLIEKSDGCDFYVNGTKVSSATALDYSSFTADIGIMCRYDNGSASKKFNGYLSKLALYNTTITEDKYMLYYNSTKSNYQSSSGGGSGESIPATPL